MLMDHREVHTGFSGSDLFGGDESLTTLWHIGGWSEIRQSHINHFPQTV